MRTSVVVAYGLNSCDSRALEHRLNSSCFLAYGIFRTEPMSSTLAGGFFIIEPPGEAQRYLLKLILDRPSLAKKFHPSCPSPSSYLAVLFLIAFVVSGHSDFDG